MDSPVEYTDTISPVCLAPDCFDESGQSVIAMAYQHNPHKLETKNNDFLEFMRLSTLPMTNCYVKDVDFMLCAYQECGDFCPVSNMIHPKQATPCGRSKFLINYFVL
jgi:hypothetical protein